jgi:UDP:flavonoid glycosyltransferase YjiC (YdhE family)
MNALVSRYELDRIQKDANIGLLFVDAVYRLEALVCHLKTGIPVIVLNTSLPMRGKLDRCARAASELNDVMRGASALLGFVSTKSYAVGLPRDLPPLLARLPEIVLAPQVLAPPPFQAERGTVFAGLGLGGECSPAQRAGAFVYCAFGTQGHVRPELRAKVARAVIDAVDELGTFEGKVVSDDECVRRHEAKRCVVVPWADQKRELKSATVAIVHGGLGTIKECIWAGVPMIVCPFGRDNFVNGRRVEELGLGVVFDAEHGDTTRLAMLIERVSTDAGMAMRVASLVTQASEDEAWRSVRACILGAIVSGDGQGKPRAGVE